MFFICNYNDIIIGIMIENYEILIRLLLALFLGALLGIERIHAGKTAGLRTFSLVSLGSALAIIVAEQVIARYTGIGGNPAFRFDPIRLMAGLIQGIGFIGAGMIIFQKDHVANLTTAAGVWVSSVIGMAVGFGLYTESIVTTLLVVFTFTLMWNIERGLKNKFTPKEK